MPSKYSPERWDAMLADEKWEMVSIFAKQGNMQRVHAKWAAQTLLSWRIDRDREKRVRALHEERIRALEATLRTVEAHGSDPELANLRELKIDNHNLQASLVDMTRIVRQLQLRIKMLEPHTEEGGT